MKLSTLYSTYQHAGIYWQRSVLSKSVSDPSTLSPQAGDRYIVGPGPVGDWLGKEDFFAEWDGSQWNFTIPIHGHASLVEDEDVIYIYSYSEWINIGSAWTSPGELLEQQSNQFDDGTRRRIAFYFDETDDIMSADFDEFDVNHNLLNNYYNDEHINWTIDQGTTTNIHDANITSSSVTQHEADIDHDALTNYNSNEHINHTNVSINSSGILNGGGDLTSTRTISLESSGVDHDQTTNYIADEHIDWTSDQGSTTNIHDNNIALSSITQYEGDIDHNSLANTHQNVYTDSTPTFVNVNIGGAANPDQAVRKDYVDGLFQEGLYWRPSVIDFYDPSTGLPSASDGDRYISDGTANGWEDNNIYEYEGSSDTWTEFVPSGGWTTLVRAEDRLYVYREGDVNDWVALASYVYHNNLNGLQGGITDEKYHLSSTYHSRATTFLDGGTNTHTDVDSHISSTSNPHSVTNDQVGLGDVLNITQAPSAHDRDNHTDIDQSLLTTDDVNFNIVYTQEEISVGNGNIPSDNLDTPFVDLGGFSSVHRQGNWTWLANNFYRRSSDNEYIYRSDDYALGMKLNKGAGKVTFQFAPSGTSGDIANLSISATINSNGIYASGYYGATTDSRTSTTTTTLLQAKAMGDHTTSGDHDSRYAYSTHDNSSHSETYIASSDTDVSTTDWVLDEDDFSSNSDTKVATQQSVKSYVDNFGGLSWSIISTDTDATIQSGYLIDASSNPVILKFPASPSEGDTIGACDYTNSASTNTITLSGNGNNIEGSSSDLIIDVDGSGFTLVYSDANRGWEIVSEIGSLKEHSNTFHSDIDQSLLITDDVTFNDISLTNPTNAYNLNHDSFSGFVSNEHINHTNVSVSAGTGLTGGGDISANRTINIDETSDITFNSVTPTYIDFNSEYNIGTVSSNTTINWNNGNNQVITLSADITLSFSNMGVGHKQLRVVQDSTGGRTPTLPSGKWPGGISGSFSTSANAEDILSIYNNGSSYYYQLTKGWS